MCIWEFWACEKCLKSYPKCIWHIFCSFAACSLAFYISHHAIKSRIEKQCAKQRKQKSKLKRRKYGIVRPKKVEKQRERKENTQQKSKEYKAATRGKRRRRRRRRRNLYYLPHCFLWMMRPMPGSEERKKTKTKQNKIGENVCLYTMVHSGQWQQQQQH